MRETKVEEHLRVEVQKRGGRCLKFVSPGKRGVPDRIVQWPAVTPRASSWRDDTLRSARTHYVETKAPGKGVEKDGPQDREAKWLKRHGFYYFLLDTKAKVDAYIARHAP